MDTNELRAFLWNVFTIAAGICGIVVIKRVVYKSKDIIELEEIIKKQSELISLKDETIKSLTETVKKYKDESGNHTNSPC